MKMQLKFKVLSVMLCMIINSNDSTNIETVNISNNISNIKCNNRIRKNILTEISTHTKRVSRQRRYIAFPDGASFSVAICATIGVVGNPNPAFLSYGLNWGVAYDLPNQTWVLDHLNGFKNRPYRYARAIVKRQHLKNIYKHIETAVEHLGFNGRDCILRALCESKKYFLGKGTYMIEEIIRILFSLPKIRVYSNEHSDIAEYDKAFRYGHIIDDCGEKYFKCGFSLIELAFGSYSEPPPDFWDTN